MKEENIQIFLTIYKSLNKLQGNAKSSRKQRINGIKTAHQKTAEEILFTANL